MQTMCPRKSRNAATTTSWPSRTRVSLADHRRRIGTTVDVLVEGPSKNALKQDATGPRQLTGRTMTDHIVVFEGNDRLIGNTVSVRIDEATSFTLFGTVVTGEHLTLSYGEASRERQRPEASLTAEAHRVSLPLL